MGASPTSPEVPAPEAPARRRRVLPDSLVKHNETYPGVWGLSVGSALPVTFSGAGACFPDAQLPTTRLPRRRATKVRLDVRQINNIIIVVVLGSALVERRAKNLAR